MESKSCYVCGVNKLLNEFTVTRGKITGRCKLCTSKYQAAYREKNKEVLKIKDAEKYKRNKCKRKVQAAEYYLNNKNSIQLKHKEYVENNRESVLLKMKEWYYSNIDHVRLYREINKDIISKRLSMWRDANKEALSEYSRQWCKRNLHTVRKNSSKRRARKFKATPIWASTEFEEFFEQEIYHLSRLRTDALGRSYHVDHIVPLNSQFVCGLHCAANMQIISAKENSSKGNRYWPDMWTEEDYN